MESSLLVQLMNKIVHQNICYVIHVCWGGGSTCISGWISSSLKDFSKHTQSMYFPGMKKDPKYAFLHAFFPNFFIMSFPKLVNMTKTTPFSPILHVFALPNDVRMYIGWSWKTTLITWIFDKDDIQLQIQVAPGQVGCVCSILKWTSLFLSDHLHQWEQLGWGIWE